MQRVDFKYDLPKELIAQYPLKHRGDSRLLYLDGNSGRCRDLQFIDLDRLLSPNDLVVFNDTRVMAARLFGEKATGGKVEILIERVVSPGEALAHVRASKSPRPGTSIRIGDIQLSVMRREGELFLLALVEGTFYSLMDEQGHVPLPPYIERADSDYDQERYQTVYAKKPGAVAAPTAGLHFDSQSLQRLKAKGVTMGTVTLHVGAGTFQPVRAERLEEHVMHNEHLEVTPELVSQVRAARARGGRVVAVGTTSVRSLETAAQSGEIAPYAGDTQLFIWPGYRFRCVDAMITNFHLPESTLLMLVCAFAGYEQVMAAYRHAVTVGYRFFSYGDAMFLTRRAHESA